MRQFSMISPSLTFSHMREFLVNRRIFTLKTQRNHLSVSQNKSATYNVQPENSTKWLFPVYKEMEMMAVGHKYGCLVTGGTLRFNSAQPLTEDLMKTALTHLQKKLKTYICYIKKRNGQLWVCEDPHASVDFQIFEGVTDEDVVQEWFNSTRQYDKTPVWRTCLIPVNSEAPSHSPEISAKFPYQYDFILNPHHAFGDGHANAFTMSKIVELIGDLFAGRSIDDNIPFGKMVSNEEIEELDKKITQQLEKDPAKLELIKQELVACDKPPILLKAYPAPGGEQSTNHIHGIIDAKTLSDFSAACKKNGVTINTGLEAAVNTALVEMVRDAGIREKAHDISINLSTDLRRYMKQRPYMIMGLHLRPTVHRISTQENVRDHFWEYASNLHERLYALLTSGEALQQHVVRNIAMPPVNIEEYFEKGPKLIRDYGFANLGNITRALNISGDYLQVTDVKSHTGIKNAMFMMLHQVTTIKGYTYYSISYNKCYMSDDTANILLDRILKIVKQFSQ